MRTRLISSIAIAAVTLTACGGGSNGEAQSEVAQMMIDALTEDEPVAGVTVHEACIREGTSKLSDEDAKAIIEAGTEGEAVVSEEADAIAASLFDCIIVDQSQLDSTGSTSGVDG